MVSILVPAVFGVIFYKYLPSPIRALVIFTFYGAVGEAIGYICYLQKVNNMPLFHIHSLIEFSFLALIFYQVIRIPRNKILLVFSFVCFLIFTITDLIFYTSIFEPNSVGKTIESTILIVLLILFISEIRNSKKMMIRLKRPYLILAIGLLVFFLGTVLVSFYSDSLMKEEMYKAWTIRSVLNFLLNILYAVVIWNSVGLRKSS